MWWCGGQLEITMNIPVNWFFFVFVLFWYFFLVFFLSFLFALNKAASQHWGRPNVINIICVWDMGSIYFCTTVGGGGSSVDLEHDKNLDHIKGAHFGRSAFSRAAEKYPWVKGSHSFPGHPWVLQVWKFSLKEQSSQNKFWGLFWGKKIWGKKTSLGSRTPLTNVEKFLFCSVPSALFPKFWDSKWLKMSALYHKHNPLEAKLQRQHTISFLLEKVDVFFCELLNFSLFDRWTECLFAGELQQALRGRCEITMTLFCWVCALFYCIFHEFISRCIHSAKYAKKFQFCLKLTTQNRKQRTLEFQISKTTMMLTTNYTFSTPRTPRFRCQLDQNMILLGIFK